MDNESALKHLLSPSVVKAIGAEFAEIHRPFELKRYAKNTAQIKDLELKARVLLVTKALRAELPEDFKKALSILHKIIKRRNLTGFQLWPVSEYISQFGLEDFSESMELMKELTQVFTSEFAIRPFIEKNHEKVLLHFSGWINHESEHVRRWISEGLRPFLPWAQRVGVLSSNPGLALHLLEELRFDDSLYVRKSVANHLNDVSKKDPLLVVKTLKKWMKESGEHEDKILWIRNHALRTLIKQGHPEALKLIGVSSNVAVEVSGFKLHQKSVSLGEHVDFEFTLTSTASKPQKLVVDYAIWFVKASGVDKGKVFKLKTFTLNGRESLTIKKRHSLKKITTMKFHRGTHFVSLQVNGKVYEKLAFELKV